jgi:hypothetical protein
VSYFFGDSESTSYPFISGSVGYAKLSTSGLDGSGLVFGIEAGVAAMLSRSVALTFAASYSAESITIDQLDDSFAGDTFAIEMGVQAFLF